MTVQPRPSRIPSLIAALIAMVGLMANLVLVPQVASAAGDPGSGWFITGPNYPNPIYNNGSLSISWGPEYVLPHPVGTPATWIYYVVTYKNVGNTILYFTCNGLTDPSPAREWIMHNGTGLGYVAAAKTLCSTSGPNWNATLGLGRSFESWAWFHNVPQGPAGQNGDKVSIQWYTFGSSRYQTPFWNYYAGYRPPPPGP